MSMIKQRGLYRTPAGSYIRLTVHKNTLHLVNIVTGKKWQMPLLSFRTMRYVSRMNYCGAIVKGRTPDRSTIEAAA